MRLSFITFTDAISAKEAEFVKAIRADTGKTEFEATLEVSVVLRHLRLLYEQSDFQTLTERVAKFHQGGRICRALGAALIVGHWTCELTLSQYELLLTRSF